MLILFKSVSAPVWLILKKFEKIQYPLSMIRFIPDAENAQKKKADLANSPFFWVTLYVTGV